MATGDSDDEYEPFQVTEEEFLPKRRKMTKEDHIYGLWAEHDSDEDDRYVAIVGEAGIKLCRTEHSMQHTDTTL